MHGRLPRRSANSFEIRRTTAAGCGKIDKLKQSACGARRGVTGPAARANVRAQCLALLIPTGQGHPTGPRVPRGGRSSIGRTHPPFPRPRAPRRQRTPRYWRHRLKCAAGPRGIRDGGGRTWMCPWTGLGFVRVWVRRTHGARDLQAPITSLPSQKPTHMAHTQKCLSFPHSLHDFRRCALVGVGRNGGGSNLKLLPHRSLTRLFRRPDVSSGALCLCTGSHQLLDGGDGQLSARHAETVEVPDSAHQTSTHECRGPNAGQTP